MGNVIATSKPPALPAPPGFDAPAPAAVAASPFDADSADAAAAHPAGSSSTAAAAASSGVRENPGSMEDLHKRCKDVMPSAFEGAKLVVQKGLSNHFQVSHTINLASSTPSGYRFGATYVGTQQTSPAESFPILMGDIDPAGNLNANVIHQLTPQLRCKFASQIQQSKISAAQLSTDYRGDDFTATLTVANPNVLNESGVVVAHYLQAVTRNLALGSELVYQYGPQVPGGEVAVASAAARYINGPATWSGSLGMAALHLCYYRRASDKLQLGVELESNFRIQESTASIAYQIDLPRADCVFRGMLTSDWTVAAVLEKRLQPLPFTFALSGVLNHPKNAFKVGVGMIVG